jgi:riboflavin kinase/FMN adenylyltransferase
MADTNYHDFIADTLVGRLGMKHLVVGYDFHMGRGREGSQEMLCGEGARAGFGCTIVPPAVQRGTVVSSTKIRTAVLERKLQQAARFLGRSYFFDAEVVAGEGIGRTLDFPTANVEVPGAAKLIPPEGVYAVRVDIGKNSCDGMMNIGKAPTLHAGGRRRIEIHLFDFSGDLYGERMRVHCVDFVRMERTFASSGELKIQLSADRKMVAEILEKRR